MVASIAEIANLVNGIVIGDSKIIISDLSPIDNIIPGSLVFADGKKNLSIAENSQASAILVNNETHISNKTIIQVPQPLQAFLNLINLFHPPFKPKNGIDPTAIIAKDSIIGKQVSIGAYVTIDSGTCIKDNCIIKNHVVIGKNVTIGTKSTIYPHVTIYDKCLIGNNVLIHAGTVIGSDGFGYTLHNGERIKIPHVGKVIIEDNVEIGANVVIDRATLGETIIGEGTKIDNLVQIAHSVRLGKHNIICAFTGIAGSVVSGDHVIFAANVGVGDHVCIDDGVILGARAGVPSRKHLIRDNIYLGNPARPKEKALKQELASVRLPAISKKLRDLNQKLANLEKQFKDSTILSSPNHRPQSREWLDLEQISQVTTNNQLNNMQQPSQQLDDEKTSR